MRLGRIAIAVLMSSVLATAAASQTLVSTGSGFLVNNSGWVMTNAHVVEGCDVVREEALGEAASIIRDTEADLALVLFRGEHDGEPLPIRKDAARLTEGLVALGYPLSDILGSDIRATTGTVSSLAGIQGDPRYIQVSAPIQPGNSGGPVIDVAGNVIGVATAVLADQAYENSQNVNFAITAREVTRFINANGLAFVSARADVSPEGSTDPIESATASTYLLQCFTDEPTPSPPLVPPSARSTPDMVSGSPLGMVSYSGMDVLGFDYRTIRDTSLSGCQASCEADGGCRAYTFNVRYDVCFLKSDAMVLVENDNAVGGYDRDLADDVVDSGLVTTADVDSVGGDYRRIRNTGYVECTLECGIDLQCRAFAFVRRTGDCWLKDTVGPLQSTPGVEFGRRR